MKRHLLLASVIALFATPALASAAIEGEKAKTLYEAKGASAKVLAQKDKTFIVRDGGQETPEAAEIHVKAGETFFLTNEEEKYVHNVYDTSDNSWVLKKQEPSEVAAITFDNPGEHKLRCAIHPKMKINVIVE